MIRYLICAISLICCISGCYTSDNTPLPVLGNPEIVGGDTIPHTIGPFSLLNQDSILITNASFSDHIYLSDFFFMHCPTICPKVKKQMLRVYDRYKDNPEIILVSHTLDPKRDTPDNLKTYAENLEINQDKWIFLTGKKEHIYDIKNDYFIAATEDPDAPGGIAHSGKIILVDKKGQVRSFAEGTDPKEVNQMMEDIDKLLKEYAQ